MDQEVTMDDFVDVEIEEGEGTIAVTSFKFFGHVYSILTSDMSCISRHALTNNMATTVVLATTKGLSE
jgi:NifU-like protein involved in Fe-S cluster formation